MKKITLALCAIILVSTSLISQTVSSFTDGTPDDAIAIDSNGNIYCSNYVGDTVFKFTPNGDVTSFITGLNTPNGLAFNSLDELYVCDGQGDTIYKYDNDGNLLDSYPVSDHPSGIVKSPDNDIMIFTKYQGNSIHSLAPDGTIDLISSDDDLNGPVGLAFDGNGNLYVGNYNNREIYKVINDGDLDFIAEVPTDGGPMPNLGFIAYGQGFLWGTTMGSDKIYRINPNGINDVMLFAGSSQGSLDGDISQATFNTPNGILFNELEDTMYITDFGSKNLRIISDVVLGFNNNDNINDSLKLVPNPANDSVRVSSVLYDHGNYTIRISDTSGKTIYKFSGQSEQLLLFKDIDVSSLKKGVYLVTLISGNRSVSKKLIK